MNKKIISPKNIFTMLALIYVLITILAIVSLVFNVQNANVSDALTSLGKIKLILKEIWWPILIIVIFIITYLLYNSKDCKKSKLAGILQFLTGISMLINTVINIASSRGENFTVILSFIYPILLIIFSITSFTKKKLESDIKIPAKKI